MELIYRGRRDGFSKAQFLNKCQGKSKILFMCTSLDSRMIVNVFGGFIDLIFINDSKY